MKFKEAEDKLDMLKTTFSLLDYKIASNYYCCGTQGEWLDSLSIGKNKEAYEISFISNKNSDIEVVYIREFKRHRDHTGYDFGWKKVKSVEHPTEDQINEVFDFFIAEVGADKNGV
ncbi:hypothetical protein D3C87_76430 [compost metagenome]